MKLTQTANLTHTFLRHRFMWFTQALQALHTLTVTKGGVILKQWITSLQLTHAFKRPVRFMKLTQITNLTHTFLRHRYMKFSQTLKTLHEWTLPITLFLKQWFANLQVTHTFKRPTRKIGYVQLVQTIHAFTRPLRQIKFTQSLQVIHSLLTIPSIFKQWFASLNVTHTFQRPLRKIAYTQVLKISHVFSRPSRFITYLKNLFLTHILGVQKPSVAEPFEVTLEGESGEITLEGEKGEFELEGESGEVTLE